MRLYTTCRDCGTTLLMLDRFNPPTHPGCDTTPTFIEDTLERFLTAVRQGDQREADRLEQLVADATPRPTLADTAMRYASQFGWPVFPLAPGEKRPITRHGHKDATTDPDQVRRWWLDTPNANIGLPTGILFDVVDIDVPNGSMAWADLQRSGACPDIHGLVNTSSGGTHAYILPTGGGNLAGSIAPGIDYRGKGGFVVCPPSRRADGRRWSWTMPPSPVITTGSKAVAA